MNANDGTIVGYPSSAGTYPLSLDVVDATGATATSNTFTINVVAR